MTVYTDTFGGANIYPSEISYSALSLTANVTLAWPEETSASSNFATRIMDVSSNADTWVITLPAATGAGTGETILFNNQGAHTVIVNNSAGTAVATLAAGSAWQVYLTDNTTTGGTWATFQYGASVSSANAAALAGTGIVAVGTLLSQSTPISSLGTNYTAASTDRAKFFVWTAAGGTITLPDAVATGNNWFILFRNSGSGAVVLDPTGAPTIDGEATKTYQPGESSIIATDGANYYTMGFGQSSVFAFDYTSIAVAGSGTYTLAGTELNRIVYKFTGALTGARTVVVPATVQQYWVDNETTGAYTFTIKTALGTGLTLATGERAIMYCDGTNVLDADTAGVSIPVTVIQGGTGATTASGARTNLGATSLGDSLFTAVSQAAAWSALGNAPAVTGGIF